MGVWGGVIFQPLDLPDTPPVTVRLQRRNDRFYSSIPIHNHQLADLGRAQAYLTLKNILHLREKLVILKS
jgi:hypothetical protein